MVSSTDPDGSSDQISARKLHLTCRVGGFRAFREHGTLELRPLTLLYGHNQAGKSTLLRLVSLLSDSLRTGVRALDMRSPALREATFKELCHMGKQPVLTPSLEIAASGIAERPQLTLRYSDEDGVVVEFIDILHGAHKKFFRARRVDRSTYQQGVLSAPFEGDLRGLDWQGKISFRNLLPEGLPTEVQDIVAKLNEALTPLQRVQWIHANRLEDSLTGKLSNGLVLATLLNDLRYRSVLDAASAWLRDEAKIADEIAIGKDGDGRPRFTLGFMGREPLPLFLAGEGARSLAMVLLCACWAEWGKQHGDPDAPTALAIEEPEMNLHPHLHVALFQRLLKTVQSGIPVVVETHSVYILRAMQLAVLRNEIAADDVGLHWISQGADGAATAEFVRVGSDAELSGWRPDVYEKEQELAHDILDARWKRLESP